MDIYRLGSRGEGVRQIQKALKVMADGIFGTNTEEAVRCSRHGLSRHRGACYLADSRKAEKVEAAYQRGNHPLHGHEGRQGLHGG